MKLKAITSSAVSLRLGPAIEAGATVDFGEDIPAELQVEIEENVKAGLLAVVSEPPHASPAPVAANDSAARRKGGPK